MGETVKLTSGRHRRTGDDGTPVVFEAGDVFEATDAELEAFGDKLEPVEKDGDEWVATRSTPGVDNPEAGEYRLLRGNHRTTDDDGNSVIVEEGETTHLTEQEARAFGDRFDKVEADVDDDRADAGDDAEAEPDPEADDADVEDAVDETEGETETDADAEADDAVDEAPALATPDGVDVPDEFPDAVPDADEWGWDALREVSKANDVDASQSKPEQVDDLRSIANAGE